MIIVYAPTVILYVPCAMVRTPMIVLAAQIQQICLLMVMAIVSALILANLIMVQPVRHAINNVKHAVDLRKMTARLALIQLILF